MRILTISNLFPPGFMGGYELGAQDIVRGLVRRGHTVEVLTSDYFVDDSGGDDAPESNPVVRRVLEYGDMTRSLAETRDRRELGMFVLPRNARSLAGRLVGFRPDAVICFNLAGLGGPGLLRLLTAAGVRPVLYLMDNVFQFSGYPVARRAFEDVFGAVDWSGQAKFVFMSDTLRREVEQALGGRVPCASFVPGWLDPSFARQPVHPRHEELVRFIYAGNICEAKGAGILLDACRLLLDRGIDRFLVHLFGFGDVPETLQRAAALRLRDHVQYIGAPQKDELQRIYADFDALVFPTWTREPFGFVAAEAAAAGCLPIMTAGIGASEWFLDGIDSLKIARDPEALATAMARVIALHPDARLALRRRARVTAEAHLGFESALDSIEQTLRDAARPVSGDPRAAEAALAILTEIWRSRRDDRPAMS